MTNTFSYHKNLFFKNERDRELARSMEPTPREIRYLRSKQIFQRYDKMKLRKRVDLHINIIYIYIYIEYRGNIKYGLNWSGS